MGQPQGTQPGRRLPIFTSTADAIRRWQDRLRALGPVVTADAALFPAPSSRGFLLTRSTRASYFGQKFRAWVNTVPGLDQLLKDLVDTGIPFGSEEIVLYGLRHAYAQSLADAGVQPDVLMQLWTRRAWPPPPAITGSDSNVSATRSASWASSAATSTAPPAPITNLETYERTEVATILGGCSEPANVKAGGKACPIRFQCGACTFYRPDPTYVPEIEDEIRRLRKDVAAAELCSTRPVVENLEYNLAMMQAVLPMMNDSLAALTGEEQAIYEVFHAEARKSRKLLQLNLTVIESPAAT